MFQHSIHGTVLSGLLFIFIPQVKAIGWHPAISHKLNFSEGQAVTQVELIRKKDVGTATLETVIFPHRTIVHLTRYS